LRFQDADRARESICIICRASCPARRIFFRPVKIAVPPTTTSLGAGDIEVGRIYRSDGNAQNILTVLRSRARFSPTR